MRLNWLTELRGASVTLRPYRASHVSRYHAWMSDAALLEATASEQLTLAEEHANQRAWVDDESKLTFLVFETAALSDADGCAGLVGDVNAFLMSRAHGAGYAATGAGRAAPDETAAGGCDGDGVTAEVMVMIAEPAARRRGFAVEAVAALLRYCMEHLGVRTAVAKISASNAPSLALFQQRLGFVESRRLPCFEEVHLAAGAAQGLRERVDALTARSGYAEARCEPAEGDDVPPPAR